MPSGADLLGNLLRPVSHRGRGGMLREGAVFPELEPEILRGTAGLRPYEPTTHKSVDYRAFKRGFQASRKQSQSLHMKLIK
jgi:hypothetical protein